MFLIALLPSLLTISYFSRICRIRQGKYETIRQIIASEQAMPFMNPEGMLTSDVDVDFFLTQVPFHCTYDPPKAI